MTLDGEDTTCGWTADLIHIYALQGLQSQHARPARSTALHVSAHRVLYRTGSSDVDGDQWFHYPDCILLPQQRLQGECC